MSFRYDELHVQSFFSPRDSTWSQLSYLVLSIQVYSNYASLIFVHRPHFCCSASVSHICMLLISCSSIPSMAWQRASCISARNTSPPTTNISTRVVQHSHFTSNSCHPRCFYYRDNCSMTFNYMVYMFSTCMGFFSVLIYRSVCLNCINYHAKTLIYMFHRKFCYMFMRCILNDFEAHRWHWSCFSSSKVATCQVIST